MDSKQEDWTLVIKPRDKWYQLNLGEIWNYRDLLFLMVKRDFVAVYKQTILGPLWFVLQPVLTALMYYVLFTVIMNSPTDGVPPILFFLGGVTFWGIFAETINKTSATFTQNTNVFGKVYFPRMIVPIATVLLNLIKFGVQFVVFIVFYLYYAYETGVLAPRWEMLYMLPVLVLLMAGLGLGFGVFISALTTKYRDLQKLVSFGTQLLMYGSFVVIPISWLAEEDRWWAYLNPMTAPVVSFKNIFLGSGEISWWGIGYSAGFMVVMMTLALLIFHKVEKSFMDTV